MSRFLNAAVSIFLVICLCHLSSGVEDETHQETHLGVVGSEFGTRKSKSKQCIKSSSTETCSRRSQCCSRRCIKRRCSRVVPKSNAEVCPTFSASNASCLLEQLDAFLGLPGMAALLDGTLGTNLGPLVTPPTSKLPTDAKLNSFYMYFAGAAYCERTLPTLKCPWCGNITSRGYTFHALISNPIENTRAFIAISKPQKEIVLSFRGTDNVFNAVTDLAGALFEDGKSSPIRIHVGFKTAVDSIYPKIISNLTSLLSSNPDFKVVVTGHSLGGAMASVFAFRLKYRNLFKQTKVELYTYGCPRVGNKALQTT